MNKKQLVDAVTKRLDIAPWQADEAVTAVFEEISDRVAAGESVNIRGFGKFSPVIRKEKIGRNMYNGSEIVIPEKLVAKFKPGSEFRKKLKHEDQNLW